MRKVNLNEAQGSSDEPFKAGKFESRVHMISESFNKVAHQLEAVGKNMQERLKLLGNTVSTVQNGWSKSAHAQAHAPAAKRGPSRASGGSRTKAASPDTAQGALGGLRKHLDKA